MQKPKVGRAGPATSRSGLQPWHALAKQLDPPCVSVTIRAALSRRFPTEWLDVIGETQFV
jgi:hypothetical protein